MAALYGLTDDERAALFALQDGSPAPDRLDRVWEPLLQMGMVWLDDAMRPPTIRLTPFGRRYPRE
jgi:hypothetical protein